MKSKLGFTLVELLVVIAIISILAAIVVPQVQGHLLRTRMTKCEAEINSIEMALQTVLTNANKSSLKHLFRDPNVQDNSDVYSQIFGPPTTPEQLEQQIEVQTDIFYQILRQGRNADLPNGLQWADGVREKLGTSYLQDLNRDGWDQLYQIYAGPWEPPLNATEDQARMPFRAWRANVRNPDLDRTDPSYEPYRYTDFEKGVEDDKIPGNPDPDGGYGFPASPDKMVYIFSMGVNLRSDQDYMVAQNPNSVPNSHKGGGDDINNWDKTRGWQGFYAG